MANDNWFFVGNYTNNSDSKGVYVFRMDPTTGGLEFASTSRKVVDPGFVVMHPNGRNLYSVNEVNDFEGKGTGGVSAFAFDPATGQLTLLNQQSSVGKGPCHVSVDATGKYALVACYVGGGVTMLPIQEDGLLAPACDYRQHVGSSVDPRRQKKPFAHSIWPDPTNRFAFAPDLGTDKVIAYKLDLENGRLLPNDVPYVRVPPGGGPRHLDFSPDGQHVYVINEIGNTITVFAYDDANGVLMELESVCTLPEGFEGTSHTADVHVAPSGKFVYGSNRGHDSIVIFAVDKATGKLSLVGHEPTQGKFPRNFALDPSGHWLYVANQNSDNIVTFRVDEESGKLTPTGQVTEVPRPICIKMLPME